MSDQTPCPKCGTLNASKAKYCGLCQEFFTTKPTPGPVTSEPAGHTLSGNAGAEGEGGQPILRGAPPRFSEADQERERRNIEIPQTRDAARAELRQRYTDADILSKEVLFFAVSPVKLVVMSIVTLGFYEYYWFYKNWGLVRERSISDIWPFWRAFFGIFWCYPCFREIEKEAASHKLPCPPANWLAGVWIILTVVGNRMPGFLWLLFFLATPFVLAEIQKAANRVNTVVAPNHDPNSSFSVWNILCLVIGGPLFMFIVMLILSSPMRR